jgi:hypothetical protein
VHSNENVAARPKQKQSKKSNVRRTKKAQVQRQQQMSTMNATTEFAVRLVDGKWHPLWGFLS